MTDLWTPSDELLLKDPIAAAKVANPHSSPDLSEAGIVLPDGDAEANEEMASLALAEADGDDTTGQIDSGAADDDDDIDDPHDADPIGDEV